MNEIGIFNNFALLPTSQIWIHMSALRPVRSLFGLERRTRKK